MLVSKFCLCICALGSCRGVKLGFVLHADCEVFEGLEFSAALNLIDGNNIIVEDAAECCSLCTTTPGSFVPLHDAPSLNFMTAF